MRAQLTLAAVVAALFSSCTPTVALVPCNADEDCASGEQCLRGVCAEAEQALGPRPDAGVHPVDDGGPPPDGAAPDDGGRPGAPDAGASDAGDDSGPPPGDGGLSDDGGDALPDAGDPTDGGTDPILDAGPPGIVSFTATPETVTFGGSVTLAWETREVGGCTLEGSEGTLEANGSLVVERPAKRPYVLRCKGNGGETYEADVLVNVACTSVVELGSLAIRGDDDLASFPTGACVDVNGDVVIANLSGADLGPLYGLRSVGGDLSIGGHPNLTRLDGLEMLRTVGGDLRLGFQEADADPLLVMPTLTSAHGLSALESVGVDFDIVGAESLSSLAGLERLHTVGDDLEMYASAVVSFGALRRLTHIGSSLELESNPSLVALGFPALADMEGALRLAHLPALTDLSALSSVSGELDSIDIVNCDALETLTGLEGITGLRLWVNLQQNDALQNLDGLGNLKRAERVVIRRNAGLASAELRSLERVSYAGPLTCDGTYCDGDLAIDANPALEHLDGFGALIYVGRNLVVYDNDALARIDGFRSLSSVNNDFILRGNARLTRVTGFDALAEADDVIIEHNASLSLLELSALRTVDDDVTIVNNDDLASLAGITQLTHVGGDLVIDGNAVLSNLGDAPLSNVGDYPTCSRGCLVSLCANPELPQGEVYALLGVVGRPVDDNDTTVQHPGNGNCP